MPWTRQRIGDRAYSVAAPRAWNRLPTELKLLRSTDLFHRDLKTFLSTGTRIRIDSVMCLGLIVGGAIQMPQLQLQTYSIEVAFSRWRGGTVGRESGMAIQRLKF